MTTVLKLASHRTDSKEEGPNTWKGQCGNIAFSRETNYFEQIVFLCSPNSLSSNLNINREDSVETVQFALHYSS